MPCYFQCDSNKGKNNFYTESHTRSLKITWHIYLIFSMHRLDTVLLDPHMIYWITLSQIYHIFNMNLVRGKTAFTLNPIQGH